MNKIVVGDRWLISFGRESRLCEFLDGFRFTA